MLGDDEAEQHAPRDLENTFLGAIRSEFCKGLLKIGNEVVNPFGLNYNVVNVGFNGPPNEVPKAFEHTALVRSPSVLQTERH